MAPKRLPNAVDPPAVLRPQDLVERSSNFTPRHGFGERKDRAQLDGAGHRMINHHSRNPGAYAGELIFDRELALPFFLSSAIFQFTTSDSKYFQFYNWNILGKISFMCPLMLHDGKWRILNRLSSTAFSQ